MDGKYFKYCRTSYRFHYKLLLFVFGTKIYVTFYHNILFEKVSNYTKQKIYFVTFYKTLCEVLIYSKTSNKFINCTKYIFVTNISEYKKLRGFNTYIYIFDIINIELIQNFFVFLIHLCDCLSLSLTLNF